ncbi:MAG: hypothetical protein AAFP04_12495 [Myxococcota bacterium]
MGFSEVYVLIAGLVSAAFVGGSFLDIALRASSRASAPQRHRLHIVQ